MGRLKHVIGALNSEDRGAYNRALRQAQNGIIQSTGSDLSLNSIVYADHYFREHKMLSQVVAFVHDSITVDAYPGEWLAAYDILLYSMKTLNEHLDFVTCPLGIDVDLTTNMGDHFTVKEIVRNKDGSVTFTGKGYDYVVNDILKESRFAYELVEDKVLEEKEVVEEVGSLIARKTINISFDNQKFIEQKRAITLMPKNPREIEYSQEKYELEQAGSKELPTHVHF